MNLHDIHTLMDHGGYPSLTITLATHRTSPDNRQDRIRVRNLVQQAKERLAQEFSARDLAPLTERLDALTADINYRHTLDGLVLAVNRDFAAKYYVPFTLPERVVVADNFFTRDLVFAMNRTPRYWVLVLSERPTHLFEGAHDTLVEIREGGFPMTHQGPGGELNLPGGKGVNRSAHRDERHRQFFRLVDAAFKPFMDEDPLPLAVVGVDRYLAFFNEVSEHKDAVIATVTGSHGRASAARLAELVWPQVKAGLAAQRESNLEELGRAVGERRFTSTAGEVWRKAHEGRGHILLVEQDFHFPGKLDESGVHLLPADEAGAPIHDAVDDIIETVLSKQGRVVFTPNGALGDFQRIAMILRY